MKWRSWERRRGSSWCARFLRRQIDDQHLTQSVRSGLLWEFTRRSLRRRKLRGGSAPHRSFSDSDRGRDRLSCALLQRSCSHRRPDLVLFTSDVKFGVGDAEVTNSLESVVNDLRCCGPGGTRKHGEPQVCKTDVGGNGGDQKIVLSEAL